jgi:hypothetical protein
VLPRPTRSPGRGGHGRGAASFPFPESRSTDARVALAPPCHPNEPQLHKCATSIARLRPASVRLARTVPGSACRCNRPSVRYCLRCRLDELRYQKTTTRSRSMLARIRGLSTGSGKSWTLRPSRLLSRSSSAKNRKPRWAFGSISTLISTSLFNVDSARATDPTIDNFRMPAARNSVSFPRRAPTTRSKDAPPVEVCCFIRYP